MAEKAKIDKMSMSDLKSQYSSVIGNYNTYVGTGYFNPLGIGENRAVIERYKILKAEEEAKAAAQAAELAKYHYLNLYKHIQETGLRPDGTPATDLEKKIAPYVVAIPIIQDLSVAFAGRQYAKYNSHIPIENGMKWRLGSVQKTDAGKVYGPQQVNDLLEPHDVKNKIDPFNLDMTQTVKNHAYDIATKGKYKGEYNRPYIDSNGTGLLIQEIINSGIPTKDKYLPNGWRWDVPGSFNGRSEGIFELVIDLDQNRITHFNFTR
ncbi:hypothetical protein [Streptococcus suis]|uniref:hypothetical protein n=2 Tax=Streptococcus suis TaxID=1307 RepID=UPI000CF52780|nr:hypothetical protein [Streptococcus suis]